MSELTRQLRHCLERFRAGALDESDLRAALAQAERPRRQSILYVQTATTHPHGAVIGMSVYEEGLDPQGVDAAGEFLYPSIKAALDDGWRIVKFPETALALDEQNTYGLGFEFILERWS